MPNGDNLKNQDVTVAVSWNEIQNMKRDIEKSNSENSKEHKDIFDYLISLDKKMDERVPWKVVWIMKVEMGIIGTLITIVLGLSGMLFKAYGG